MPTGYTEKLCKQEVEFSEFVMMCAKAMGACVMLRDDPLDAPIPEKFEPSKYHAKKLEEAQEWLSAVTRMSSDECKAKASAEFESEVTQTRKRLTEERGTANRLNAMKAKVVQWNAPTSEHEGLKEFMLGQISETLRVDGDPRYYEKRLKELRQLSAEEWRQKQIVKAMHDCEYHAVEHSKECSRAEARNEWIKALRKSLEQTP